MLKQMRSGLGILLLAALPSTNAWAATEFITDGLQVVTGPVNGVRLERAGKSLVIYGDYAGKFPEADAVLFTHHRRDVVWAGRQLVAAGARAIVPAAEADWFGEVESFWQEFTRKRFHDYAQSTTKILAASMAVDQKVAGGTTWEWEGVSFKVVDTPGYTRGAVSYFARLAGKQIGFTGDLIYGDGRLFDLYSFQDAIPEAKIRGYHGYAGRLGALMTSLQKVAGEHPDVLIPARGPLIRDPAAAIRRLTARLRAAYSNYLTIDALRWYFGDDHILAKARRVLGPDAKVDWMPLAATVQKQLPDWITPIANTRLIRSQEGAGFLIDCGSQNILNQLQRLHRSGDLKSVDHLFITHYHDDHTDAVPDLVKEFGATVYACPELVDVLEHPGAYRLPAMTARPIDVTARVRSGSTWRWKEFQMTLYFFPGQTQYHQALLVRKDGGEAIFFIGDSFTPSGIDDYCLMNRNFLHPGMGYFYCLDLLHHIPADALLINQHVGPAFRFSPAQIKRMENTLRERVQLLRELTPWDDPNYALDESWARFRPYALQTQPGGGLQGTLVVLNHSPTAKDLRVRLNLPVQWKLEHASAMPVRVPPRQEGVVHFSVRVPPQTAPGLRILTADITWGTRRLPQWCECLVEVTP